MSDQKDKKAEEILHRMRPAVIGWYDLSGITDALVVSDEKDDEELAQWLQEKGCRVTRLSCVEACLGAELSSDGRNEFDSVGKLKQHGNGAASEDGEGFGLILVSSSIERLEAPAKLLQSLYARLGPAGRLLLLVNNRMGIRFWCGDRDPYTERSFDGVENYRRAYGNAADSFHGRMYDRAKWRGMLADAGFGAVKCYSVLPDLTHASHLFAENYLPNEDLITRVTPLYHSPSTVFLEEEAMYSSLARNGMFHEMANAYVIECAKDNTAVLSDMLHVTASLSRDPEDAFYTIIHGDADGRPSSVEKRAVFPEGKRRLLELKEHEDLLRSRGIRVVPGELAENAYRMPYIDARTGDMHLKDLLLAGRTEEFLKELDHFRELIFQSSESYEGSYDPEEYLCEKKKGYQSAVKLKGNADAEAAGGGGKQEGWTNRDSAKIPDGENASQPGRRLQWALLRHAFPDMVPLNSFWLDGEFVFYDQEFMEDDFPADAIVNRMVATLYAGSIEMQKRLPAERLYERYGILGVRPELSGMEQRFLGKLRNDGPRRELFREQLRDANVVNANRQRMNFSADDYERLFVDIFEHADTRKLILFGSGRFAKQFLALYGEDYPVTAIVDNQREKWGTSLDGVRIVSPDIFRELSHGEYKVIVCIKNYLSVMNQLDALGVREYSIYDAGKAYPRKRHPIVDPLAGTAAGKKYHVGYIAGVFDLFHVGHLNMFRRAKEQCDYLIVGVVSDEGVRRFKGTDPFVPFTERIEIVRSCRYVDEAQEIPLLFGGTEDAWRLYHFDVQFSGSDYIHDPKWLKEKDFLEKHGAAMEFFPYTQSTSSTKLKTMIDAKLLTFEGNAQVR